jgi:hypothetical protein
MDLRAEIAIDAPAGAVWALLGERFGQIGEWAAPITSSCVDGQPAVGAVRTCRIAGFGPFKPGTIKERLVAFERDARRLAYESTKGLPGFVKSAINRWSVHSTTEASCVVPRMPHSSCADRRGCFR